MENPEDLEHILSCHWPHLFASIDPTTPITLSKLSTRNWLISSTSNGGLSYVLKSASTLSTNSLDFELQYLIDLNRFLSNEYNVPVPISTVTGQYHANGRYWLYEYINGNVYADNDTSHLFDEKELISLAKLISKYHQFLMTHSPSLATNKRSTTREHLLDELKQAADGIPQSSSSSSTTIATTTTTTNVIDVVSQYFIGCYPLLCRLLRDSLSRQQKTNIIRSYPIHRNLRPSKVVWSSSDNNRVIGLLDFENVNHDTLWRDLAVCLSTFCTSSSPSIITDVDRMRIFIEEYMKQMSGGTARVSSQTEQEVFQLIVDEIILCAIEDFTFIYWQYIHQRDKFQGLKAMEFYYKRALWHAEHALKK
ncbi:unnamed protein product [Rotaria sp. Silwood1]|nr:unnamed protein product [Rotaria sp. Silwood1]